MWKKIIAGVVVVLLVASAGYTLLIRSTAQPPTITTPTPIDTSTELTAEARVVPLHSAVLSFPIEGLVDAVFVKEGDRVSAGQPLARLEASHQHARVDSAEAALKEAETSYEYLKAGATEYEISAAEAQLRQAEALLRQVDTGVTSSDLRAAEAQLEQAQATLARLQAGPKSTERRAAEAQLEQARAALEQGRAQLSAAKTNAELQLKQASEALVQAQTAYSMAKWNWAEVERTGNDPVNPTIADPTASNKQRENKLNDAQKQQYHDAYVRAEAQLHIAEQAVSQAQVAYDAARQSEIKGIQLFEEQVKAAQANMDRLLAGAERDQLAAARAQLASAEANLARLQGDSRVSSLDAAQAAVDAARAHVDQLRAGTPERELASARARIQSAKADLALAQLGLADTELHAPFAGIVAEVGLHAYERIAPGIVAIRIGDMSGWQIETTDLTELNIADIHMGDQVAISVDALPDLEMTGHVTRVRPFGESRQGDITYQVVIVPDKLDTRLRWNMTAAITVRVP